ncbi:MAG: hypothetical protein A3A44_01945 [Candidatus Sungbacteria bacterium RIFCSPLOWO2_01_FULL_60_25]|uniref:Uncharacterized protein n=1 Tax=Candidatus Sungbacteria bacterium RIFCSPLOWO2_01_FULL_60_25 TaxID=1802281 RepID=A0A1G2LD33_9BACT|nr:MAG: hypothetical protein A3A44_01945 [Candidatus Sungbacteria bacterium RIFCSPLOWO2_01_FULL_60_25]
MKKIIITVIAITLAAAGSVFIFRPSQESPLPQTSRPQETAPADLENIPLNANDNLDQALQDLEQLEQIE